MRRLSVLLASAVMALTLIAFAVATGASAAPKQQQQQYYGALYIGEVSQTEVAPYWKTGTSAASAKQAASSACQQAGATNCILGTEGYNGWAAFAVGDQQGSTSWGATFASTEQAASKTALQWCEDASPKGCKLVGTWKTALK